MEERHFGEQFILSLSRERTHLYHVHQFRPYRSLLFLIYLSQSVPNLKSATQTLYNEPKCSEVYEANGRFELNQNIPSGN